MTASVWMILTVILLMAVAGVLSTVETAVSAISRARVTEMVRDEVAGAKALVRVLDFRARNVNVLVLLRTLCEVAGRCSSRSSRWSSSTPTRGPSRPPSSP